MKKIEIKIPKELKNKNVIFSHCLSSLRKKLLKNDKLEGKLRPLGNTELISDKNIAKSLGKSLDKLVSTEMVAMYIRDYNRLAINTIVPIKNYSNVGDSKVYLKEDIDNLILFVLSKEKS